MCRNKFQYFVYFVFLIFGNDADANRKETNAQVTLEERIVTCPPWEDGVPTYLPYPYDCHKFIVCTNGCPIEHSCPPLTVWDQDLLTCNHEAFTPCVIVTTESPSELTSPDTQETTTTIPTTTTPPTPGPIEDGGIYTIVYTPTGMAFSVRKANLYNGNYIDAMPHVPNCSNLAQVWKLQYNSTNGFYLVRSALGAGVDQWTHRLQSSAKRPRIYQYPGTPWPDSYWKFDAVPGSQLYTIYQTHFVQAGNVEYTGVDNGIGINLDIVAPNSTVPEQQWGFVQCPA